MHHFLLFIKNLKNIDQKPEKHQITQFKKKFREIKDLQKFDIEYML